MALHSPSSFLLQFNTLPSGISLRCSCVEIASAFVDLPAFAESPTLHIPSICTSCIQPVNLPLSPSLVAVIDTSSYKLYNELLQEHPAENGHSDVGLVVSEKLS